MINIEGLVKSLGPERVKKDEPLSSHTTLQIGGPADLFYEAQSSGELIKAVRLAKSFGVPMSVIGGGSNILVSDTGIRGLVVKNSGGRIEIRENENPETEVSIDSGVSLQEAMYSLFDCGVTGLQWYSRIPGTIGGAVYNNIHGGSHNFAEMVKEVVMLDKHGGVVKIPAMEMKFDDEGCRVRNTGEIILQVILRLKKGDVAKARKVSEEWQKTKSAQPMNSAGCVFKNISEEDRKILGYPTTAVGYIVEHVLNMSGYSIGGAMISPDHHNFIVNTGKATAKDFLAVRDEIVKRAKETIGIKFEDKVITLGDFDY